MNTLQSTQNLEWMITQKQSILKFFDNFQKQYETPWNEKSTKNQKSQRRWMWGLHMIHKCKGIVTKSRWWYHTTPIQTHTQTHVKISALIIIASTSGGHNMFVVLSLSLFKTSTIKLGFKPPKKRKYFKISCQIFGK